MILGLSNPCDDDIGNSCFGGEEVDGRIARYEACKEGIVGGIKEITVIGMSWEDSGYPCSLNLMLCKA
ncbi:hypothetical protein CLOM_g16124 [Closterium sp. NIES-68]|nr:hypothetical protein CLOM_g16124 [Closterium sp. NIES-68]